MIPESSPRETRPPAPQRLHVHSHIDKIQGASFGAQLRSIASALEPVAQRELPERAQIWFHSSSEDPLTSWMLGGYARRADSKQGAMLFFNHGALNPGAEGARSDEFFNKTELDARRRGLFTGESVKTFVAKTIERAKEKVLELKLFKNYYRDPQLAYLAESFERRLGENGLGDLRIKLYEHTAWGHPCGMVIGVSPESKPLVTKVLLDHGCTVPSKAEDIPSYTVPEKLPHPLDSVLVCDGLSILLLAPETLKRVSYHSHYESRWHRPIVLISDRNW